MNPIHGKATNGAKPSSEAGSPGDAAKAAAKRGLTTEEALKLREIYGWNELAVIEISLWKVFFLQVGRSCTHGNAHEKAI